MKIEKDMEFDWQAGSYRIMQHSDGMIFASEVTGVVCEDFGIHKVEYGWSVTHLKTGWSAFTSHTREGAFVIAHHLIENYKDDFEKLAISGARVSNYIRLEEKVTADAQLTEMRRLYAFSTQRLKAEGLLQEQKMEIVS